MAVIDHEYTRRVGFALSFAQGREQSKLLKLYTVLAVFAVAMGIALGLAT